MLYVVGNNKKIQLAFDNLKEVCYKYLAEKCYIMVIDLAKNPNLARVNQIIAIPTLVRKDYPEERIIGDLANQEKVLEFLDIRINNLMGDVNEKGAIEKTSITEPKGTYLKKQEAEMGSSALHRHSFMQVSILKYEFSDIFFVLERFLTIS